MRQGHVDATAYGLQIDLLDDELSGHLIFSVCMVNGWYENGGQDIAGLCLIVFVCIREILLGKF